jgi:O-antigen/teichoic acid export membrane protein
VIFVTIGWSVNGAVGAISLSFVATWLVASRAGKGLPVTVALSTPERNAIIAFSIPVIVGLIGQILINNSDILIVKRFFPAEVAGQYAALALIGRIVFFATWSIVTTMFPIVAQKHQKGQPHRYLLGVSIGIVAFISTGIILATLIIPDFIVDILFGTAYLSIAPLLWVYAVATALYALANVIVSYRLSAGSGNGNILVALAGAAQVIGLWFFHDNLAQVVWVQVIIMAGLLSALLLWDARLFLIERQQKHSPIAVSP